MWSPDLPEPARAVPSGPVPAHREQRSVPDNDRHERLVQFIAQQEQAAQFIAHTCSSGLNLTIPTHPGDFRSCCHLEGAVTLDCGSGFLYFSIWLVKNQGNLPWQQSCDSTGRWLEGHLLQHQSNAHRAWGQLGRQSEEQRLSQLALQSAATAQLCSWLQHSILHELATANISKINSAR